MAAISSRIGWPKAIVNDPLTSAAVKWVRFAEIPWGARRRGAPAAGDGRGQGDIRMVIEFRVPEVQGEPRLQVGGTSGAEIIIFPGVRRERQTAPQNPGRREKARPKRDRLELPD
jgi:hypothetical protein